MARMRAPDRRRQLLEVAAQLFADRGYQGTTTAQLAAEAGVTEPILYRHFESKRDLFTTLIDEAGREVIATWQEALAAAPTPRKRLHVLLAGNPATHPRGEGVYRALFQAMSENHPDPAVTTALRRHVTRLHEFLTEEVAELQSSRIVRKDEPAGALAWLLVSVGAGYGIVAPLATPRREANERAADLQRLLEHVLAG